jgi:hypothetical protein
MNTGPFLLPNETLPSQAMALHSSEEIRFADEVHVASVVETPPVLPRLPEVIIVDAPLASVVNAPRSTSSWPVRATYWTFRAIATFLHGSFGVASMIAGLSVLASIPILNLLSLGYLLEVSGRVAKSGKISDALVGIHKASRVGSIVFCAWLAIQPARFLGGFWYDAYLLQPGSPEERRLWLATAIVGAFTAAYIFWAWVRGGRFRDFLWPAPIRFLKTFFSGKLWNDAANGCWDFVVSLRLPYYFSLGSRGFAGTAIWLALPIALFIAASKSAPVLAGFCNFFAVILMSFVLIYLPFAQAHFAAENKFRAMFDVAAIRDHFRKAPIFFWIAMLFTVALALPLYLAKIEYIPRELLFLPGILFITFSFPARALTGWAMGFAHRREKPRFFLLRWASRLGMIPIALIYVMALYFSQYTSWTGIYSLFEQHAFLVPAPFLSN